LRVFCQKDLIRSLGRPPDLCELGGGRECGGGKKLESKLASGRFLPNTSSWVRGDRERGLMVHYCCHAVDVLCAAQDEHGCGLEVKWRESLHARDNPQAYIG